MVKKGIHIHYENPKRFLGYWQPWFFNFHKNVFTINITILGVSVDYVRKQIGWPEIPDCEGTIQEEK